MTGELISHYRVIRELGAGGMGAWGGGRARDGDWESGGHFEDLAVARPRSFGDVEGYNLLRYQMLERDGRRCQDCGSSKDLQVHYLNKRSKLGDDTLNNLITLCSCCHRLRHEGRFQSPAPGT